MVDTVATSEADWIDQFSPAGRYPPRMKTIHDIRRERLRQLIDEELEGRQADLCRRINRAPQQVSAWLRAPGKNGAKNISDTMAREIETIMRKPYAWLDTDPSARAAASSQPVQQEREIVAAAVKLVRYVKEISVTPVPDALEADLLFHAMRIVRDSGLDGAEGLDGAARQLAASMRNGG